MAAPLQSGAEGGHLGAAEKVEINKPTIRGREVIGTLQQSVELRREALALAGDLDRARLLLALKLPAIQRINLEANLLWTFSALCGLCRRHRKGNAEQPQA